ncbi:MAG TPA: hypothetical protein VNT01_11800 [Symbiobacteriaceae bacterium]|nr:hypothetical protein [Symbiobacteriaceae bacterium]
MKPVVRLKMARSATVSPRHDPARLHGVVPTVVLHLVVAGVNGAAAMGIGTAPAPVFAGGLAACALGVPVVGLSLSLAGWLRTGAAMVVLTYISSAALGLYNFLGMGALEAALHSPEAPWKLAYFATAVLLPLLQIKGILEAGRIMVESRPE